MLAHVNRLTADQIYDRFMTDMTDDCLARWARGTAYSDVIGWFQEGILRATVEIGYRGERAECAVTCEDAYRDRHIGRQLFSRACRRARSQGATAMAMLTVCHGQTDALRMLDHPGWMVSRCYSRSIILPHAGPETPLWMVRKLGSSEGLLSGLLSREAENA